MTSFLRNAFLAAVAVSSMAGSAVAEQQTTPSCTKYDNIWGNCCNSSDCRDDRYGSHGDNGGGRGGQPGAK